MESIAVANQCIRILIVGDHAVVCKGLALVRLEADFDVVETGDGEQGVALAVKPNRPVLLDLVMPLLDGAAAAHCHAPGTLNCIYAAHRRRNRPTWRLLVNGADGYVLKDIERSLKGHPAGGGQEAALLHLWRSVLGQLPFERCSHHPPLTDVREILQWMATGRLRDCWQSDGERDCAQPYQSVLHKLGNPTASAVLAAVRADILRCLI
jgi:CheY-like chemotaxis protein